MGVLASLWSINERLGGNPGLDLEYPRASFLENCLAWLGHDAEQIRDLEEQADEMRRAQRGD